MLNLVPNEKFDPVAGRMSRGDVGVALVVSLDGCMFCEPDEVPRGGPMDWSGPKRMEISLMLRGRVLLMLYFRWENRQQATTAFARLTDCQADWFMSDDAYYMRLRALAPLLGADRMEDS